MKDNDRRLWVQTLWGPINEIHKSPLESDKPGVKVAAYCRVSTKEDIQLRSLENQVSHYTHYIRGKANWRFVGIYFDDGGSGAISSKRRGFQRLIRHAEEGKIDLILTKNVSRFARNSTELINIVEKLKQIGVGIYFEKEKIDTSIEYNKFLLSTYAAMAQEEIESMSNSIIWAHEKNMLKGKVKFSRLFGYEVDRDEETPTLRIIEEEAQAVKQIYQMYLDGHTKAAIARKLIEQGIRSSRGNAYWNSNRITEILSNITYTGNKLSGDSRKELFSNKLIKGYKDQIFMANTHKPIISMEIFNQVQEVLEKNKVRTNFPKVKKANILSKRVKCSRCGFYYTSTKVNKNIYLRCYNKMRSTCDSETLKEENIKEMMLKAMCSKYDFEDVNIMSKLQREIELINQNDNFEFHRLKYITEIEIAKKQYDMNPSDSRMATIHNFEEEYKIFEAKIIKIEDDRKIRLDLLEWMRDHNEVKLFMEHATVSILRGWIIDLEIYSSEDFKVDWVDGTTTEIGNFSEKMFEYKAYIENMLRSHTDKVTKDPVMLASDEDKSLIQQTGTNSTGFSIEKYIKTNKKESDKLYSNEQTGVVKIEPGYKNFIMRSLNKNLDEKNIRKNSSVHYPIEGKKKLRTAAYCRISSESEEQKVSLKTQVAYYTYLILKDPKYEYAGIYADEGISGRSLKNRTEFINLMDECKAGNVDLILTKSISRFSRNTLDCLEIIRMLRSLPNPVHIFFEKENIHTSDEKSELMISIYGSIAQEESINMGEALAWGKRRYAERGIVNLALIPYGYKKSKDGQWEIVDEEAAIIRMIYKMFSDGMSYTRIAKELGSRGIVSPGGNEHWITGTIKNILTHEAYKGDYLYQKGYIKDSVERKVVKNTGELPQYLIEGRHDSIITDEIWEEVQELVNQNTMAYESRKKNRFREDTLINRTFSRKYFCAHCGEPYIHIRSIRNGKESHTWTCKRSMQSNHFEKCVSKHFKQKYLEKHFMHFLLDIKTGNGFSDKVKNYMETLRLNEEEIREEGNIRNKIEKLNEELYKAVNIELNRKGQDSKKVDELTDKIVAYQEELKEYSTRRRKIIKVEEEYQWLLNELKTLDDGLIRSKNGLGYDEMLYFRDDIFEKLIEKATMYKNGKLTYFLTIGISWETTYEYKDYNKLVKEYKDNMREKKYEEYLNSEKIMELIEFCSEPKDIYEILDFMNSRNSISIGTLRKKVVSALLERGRLINVIPQGGVKNNRIYYQNPVTKNK